jgi:hypothetical protein
MSAQVPPQPEACINPWQGAAPSNVLDTNAPDHLVAAILENVDPDQIAETLLQKAQTGNQEAAAALLKVLDNIPASLLQESDRMANCDETGIPHATERKKEERPRVSSVNACEKTFKRRHAVLRMSLTRADATPLDIRQSIARHFKQFALEDPLMTAEVRC